MPPYHNYYSKLLTYMSYRILRSAFTILFISFVAPAAFAQLGNITFDLEKDKPEKFKTKTLRSEKTGDKKFTKPRRFIQNTTTHYNYYFNANNKLNEVIDRARIANKDDYTKLLPFYGYSLENTLAQKTELDSVIYKATAGILLHDLRSDWVDNLYLLIGKAYLLRKDFDSAGMTFQFINYNLFPRKKNEDDNRIVGTSDNPSANGVSIANKEKHDLVTNALSRPPSRNDALVWQIRTLIETEEYPDAAGLINTLQNDPNFPSRLKPDLEEVDAYWFYKQSIYDSAAVHLEKALSNAEDKADKARWEFLLAQLYEVSKQPAKASEYYAKAMRHTTDPLLDIYANLNRAKMYKTNEPKEIDNAISNLVHMAKRDKYETFKDIVYYSAAELALEKPDTAAAEFYLKKSLSYNETNVSFKNKAFLTLAEINFRRKNYPLAFAYYDSLKSGDSSLVDIKKIQDRRDALGRIVEKLNIIEREDSLQHIAMMPPDERETYLRKLAKKLRKDAGGIDDLNAGNPSSPFDTKTASTNIFAANDTKGDWYFYNASIKSRGFSEFVNQWGKRPNVDNWRRKSVLSSTILNPNANADPKLASMANATAPSGDVTYESLLTSLPLTNEKLNLSNSYIATSLFELGKLYQNELEDYNMAVETYERSLQRFPDSLYNGELYLDLIYSYQKLNNEPKASYYKNLLSSKFKGGKYEQALNNPKAILAGNKNSDATKSYENIYNLFIEGKFDEALQQKKIADSLYGNNYWNPQLLYIESMYYVRQRQDSMATKDLNQLINLYPTSLLKSKATTMIDVLKRRNEIEGYLTNLKVDRAKDDSAIVVNNNPPVTNQNVPANNNQPKSNVVNPPANNQSPAKQPNTTQPVNTAFNFDAASPHYVVMVLDKVDAVYISEARNALNRYNREKFSGQTIDITKEVIDADKAILVFKQFANADAAIDYATKIKKGAPGEVSWLPANKYSFIIISDANLQTLKSNKDIPGYINILKSRYPGKF